MPAEDNTSLDSSAEELKKIRHQLKELTEAVYAMAGVMLMTGMPQYGPESAVSQLRTVRTAMSTEFCKKEPDSSDTTE